MKITAVEELVIRRKRRYKHRWRDASDWYWLWKLFQKMMGLIAVKLGIHDESAPYMLEQIASISMNWIEKRAKI